MCRALNALLSSHSGMTSPFCSTRPQAASGRPCLGRRGSGRVRAGRCARCPERVQASCCRKRPRTRASARGHDAIRHVGRGAYSHWQGASYLRAPDRSDPRTDGKEFSARSIVAARPIMGLDGTTPLTLRQHIAEGRSAGDRRAARRGRARLKSADESNSSSTASGRCFWQWPVDQVNGVHAFRQYIREHADRRGRAAADTPAAPFWETAASNGIRTCVAGRPVLTDLRRPRGGWSSFPMWDGGAAAAAAAARLAPPKPDQERRRKTT